VSRRISSVTFRPAACWRFQRRARDGGGHRQEVVACSADGGGDRERVEACPRGRRRGPREGRGLSARTEAGTARGSRLVRANGGRVPRRDTLAPFGTREVMALARLSRRGAGTTRARASQHAARDGPGEAPGLRSRFRPCPSTAPDVFGLWLVRLARGGCPRRDTLAPFGTRGVMALARLSRRGAALTRARASQHAARDGPGEGIPRVPSFRHEENGPGGFSARFGCGCDARQRPGGPTRSAKSFAGRGVALSVKLL
jgi:hypothetical protein